MTDDDLDLEFEDDSVSAPTGAPAPLPLRPAAPKPQVSAVPEVKKVPPPITGGTAALKVKAAEVMETQSVEEIRQQLRRVELESQVKVAVAEFKADYLSELLSDVKLMDHQIGQILNRMYSKHPDVKQEVLMIKKLLADFTSKKRK